MSSLMWPTILLLGKNGQVGWELQRTLASLGCVVVLDQPELDIKHYSQIREKLHEIKPQLIVNAAAYTAVDRAEEEPDLAMAINGIAPGVLAEEARALGAALVHYSTDFVFDGTKEDPYAEEDIPNPVNIYGKTKLAGEQAIQAAAGNYLIFRTSWVYGTRGNNFLLTMLRLANEHDQLKIVNDQIGSPTWCRMIAEATALVLARGRKGLDGKWGTYHLTASGTTSWYDFARAILTPDLLYPKSAVELLPITSAEYVSAARRPANSLLSNTLIRKEFGIDLPSWEYGLELVKESLINCNKT